MASCMQGPDGTPPGYPLVYFEHFLGLCNPLSADRTLAILGSGIKRAIDVIVTLGQYSALERALVLFPSPRCQRTWFLGPTFFDSQHHIFSSYRIYYATHRYVTLAPSPLIAG